MTEQQWFSCDEPRTMLKFLGSKLSSRKRQLFACSCVRRVWPLSEVAKCRRAVEAAEREADGLAPLGEATASLMAPCGNWADHAAYHATRAYHDWFDAVSAAKYAVWATRQEQFEKHYQARLLRDVTGNPLQLLPSIDVAIQGWNDGVVKRLAEVAYENRIMPSGEIAPVRLAVLADALEEAGADASLAEHLRQPGPHVRGCWVVDLLLEKV